MKKQYIFLSHDVDWGFEGPSKEHILQRKDRFDKKLFETTPINQLYRNFSEFMEIEEKFGVKSTFFFRTQYENSDYRDYQDDIKKINQNGWEIGLHTDPSSINEIKKIEKEKNNLEKLTSSKIFGNRVHYLSNDPKLPKKLSELGFDKNYFSEIMTSGEMIWQSLLKEQHIQTKNLGNKCFHICDDSKKDNKSYLEGLEKFEFVNLPVSGTSFKAKSSYIICFEPDNSCIFKTRLPSIRPPILMIIIARWVKMYPNF